MNVVLSDDDCHWIVPVLPLKVNTVLFVPVHTAALPLIVPATLAGLTVPVAEIVCVVTLGFEQLTEPENVPELVPINLTQTVVDGIVPPLDVMLKAEEYVPFSFTEISKPVGAVTETFGVVKPRASIVID